MESTNYSSYKKLTGANKASHLADWLKSIDFDALMLGSSLGKHGYLGFMEHLSDEEAKKRYPKIKRSSPPERREKPKKFDRKDFVENFPLDEWTSRTVFSEEKFFDDDGVEVLHYHFNT